MNTSEKNFSEKTLKSFVKKTTVKNILKFVAVVIIISVYTLLLGRMYLAKDRGVMNRYSPTEKFLSECNESTEILTQNLSYTMDENGYYRVSNPVYIPAINELQINVRYNNSTLDAISEEYPDFSYVGEPFVYELIDNNGNTYALDSYIPQKNIIYNFRKLVFKNVDYTSAERLYLDVRFVGDNSEDSPMSVRFTVYNSNDTTEPSGIKVNIKKRDDFVRLSGEEH